LARGDVVDIVANLAPPERFWNEAEGDPRPRLARRGVIRTGGAVDVRVVERAWGILPAIDRARAFVRGRIDATFDPALAPMARALVLGETDLAPQDDRDFRASGLSHLLAVSGMHLVIVLGIALRTIRALGVRVEALVARYDVGRFVAALGIPIAWAYAELAGGGGSTSRAAWMMTAALAARALGRRTNGTRAFGISLAMMAWRDPLVVYDLSFLLSAGATGGLLLFANPLSARVQSVLPAPLAHPARAIATTLAASVPCVPIVARFSPTLPLGAVAANLIAVPIGECAALPLCLVHAVLSPWPTAERGAAATASGALILVRWIARTASLPWLTTQVAPPTSWQLVAMTTGLAACALGMPRRKIVAALALAAVLALEIVARRVGAPRGLLRVTFLDVGQGDAALIDLPDGTAVVVDGGGLVGSPVDVGERVLAPALRGRRRDEVAFAVLTHPHPDHFGGLRVGLSRTRVGAFWDSGQGELEDSGGGYGALLEWLHAAHVPVLRPERLCGTHDFGGARFEVLAPCPRADSDLGPNDNSIVLRITYGQRAFLLVGDAERAEEAKLLAVAGEGLRADVLKVGHHGSRTSSTPAFLTAISPTEAVISVGRRNRFGHPSPLTISALGAVGARVWRTDRDGSVIATTDGRSLDVRRLAVGAP
jgi:competence protein ComEC